MNIIQLGGMVLLFLLLGHGQGSLAESIPELPAKSSNVQSPYMGRLANYKLYMLRNNLFRIRNRLAAVPDPYYVSVCVFPFCFRSRFKFGSGESSEYGYLKVTNKPRSDRIRAQKKTLLVGAVRVLAQAVRVLTESV